MVVNVECKVLEEPAVRNHRDFDFFRAKVLTFKEGTRVTTHKHVV